MQVLTRTRGGCVVHRCQNKNPIERLTSGCEWRHATEAQAWRIWGILKKSVSRVESCLGRRRLTFACSRGPWAGVARDCGVGGRWKSQNRKNVYLSPYIEEPLNSKVIKCFVSELRSRKCFRVSRFLCSMYISIFTNPFARAGYDTRSIFKRSLTGLNSEFAFS